MSTFSPASDPRYSNELRSAALHWLSETAPFEKAEGVRSLASAWALGEMKLDPDEILAEPAGMPGRPLKPELVHPRMVKQRAMHTIEGRAILIHALAHIEFNAINLALDAIWRFDGMPQAFYSDWLQVAAEEALHFLLLSRHLIALGFGYGDFPAHNSLWDMAEKTKTDPLARMALVPRTMEARGLDATPGVRAKLAQAGDAAAADILDLILRDEIGHVAIGNRWFGWLCMQQGLEPVAAYRTLSIDYKAPTLRGPFNFEARRAAGFTEQELDALGKNPG
jgi:uncharacterized ferritin-like protein (DUF455 family)